MKKNQDSLFRYNIVIEDSSSEDAPPIEVLLSDKNNKNKRKYSVPSKPLSSSNDKKAKFSHDPDEFSDDDLLIVSSSTNNRFAASAAKPVPAKQLSQEVLRYNNALKSLDALPDKPMGPVIADQALQEKLAKTRRLKATIAHQQQTLALSNDRIDDDDVKQDPNTIILILRYQEGERQFTFAVKKSEKFQSLYEKISMMVGIPLEQLHIRFYHEVIEKNKTPHDYAMINQEKLSITRVLPKSAEPVKASKSNTNSNDLTATSGEGDLDFLEELERKLQNPEEKPKSAGGSKKIVLHVALPDQTKHMKLKILPTEKFEKIIDILCNESGKKIRLYFDGEDLDPQSTPANEEMEDGFQLDAKYV